MYFFFRTIHLNQGCLVALNLQLCSFLVSTFATLAAAEVNQTSFVDPPANFRPRFRYWLPDASVDPDVVAADIAAVGAIGAGGIELLPFFEYGGELGSMPAGANWSTYNFGTAPFHEIFSAALTAHEKHGLSMDFALGPNQGQGVPAEPDNIGLQWDLVPFTAELPLNGSLVGTAPGWGTGELVSLVSAVVKSESIITYEATGSVTMENVTYDQYVLASGSLVDHTQHVASNGTYNLILPAAPAGTVYRLFSFYQKLSGNKNVIFTSEVNNTIFDQGSYVVDHFDGKGALAVVDFWQKYILVDGIQEKLQVVGNYGWEDSLELIFNITWSRTLPKRFQDLFKYDIRPFLPLVSFQQNDLAVQRTEPGSFRCILDTDDQGVRYVNDFRAALSAGYDEYISTLENWLHSLGLKLSVQPAYGLAMDMQVSIPQVDVPECESLTFEDLIDAYRKFVGPAVLAGRQIISNELGAVYSAAFRYPLPELLFSANRGFASGINRYVIHGQAFSGNYYQTTWPGHIPFDYLFSEPWTPREPVWDHGLEDLLRYLGRMQYQQQSGTHKVDVAIYSKESATVISTLYSSADLMDEGWSYNYLAPENLELPQAVVENSVLAPTGPAYQAFAVSSTSNVSTAALLSLQAFAKAGLPVILVGGSPQFYPTGNYTDFAAFKSHLAVLQASEKVYSVDEGQLANQLKSLGLRPRVGANPATGTWYTTWRESNTTGTALIYADLVASEGKVTITDTRTPYFLDPWTGKRTPVLVYTQTNTSTVVPLRLKGNQTVMVAFEDDATGSPPAYHVISAPENVLGATYSAEAGLKLSVSAATTEGTATLSNNVSCRLPGPQVLPPFELTAWKLVAEHWEAPSNISNATAPTTKYNTTHVLDQLVSWTDIPALQNASGIGYYTAGFIWSGTNTNSGAYLSFANVLHSLRVQVNGYTLPPLDLTNAVADISAYLVPGNNTITATVPTTWWNYIQSILIPDGLESAGTAPLLLIYEELLGTPFPSRIDEGLLPEVWIIPIQQIVC